MATTAIIFGKWCCMLSCPSINFYEEKNLIVHKHVVNKTALEYPVVTA